jgi:hypothetical protein
MSLIGLKIGWDVARVFVMEAALTVLPPDLLYSGSDGNHDIGGLFCHFVILSSLTAILIKFVLNDRHWLLPKHIIDQQFYSRRLLAALAHAAVNMCACHSPDWRGWRLLRRFDWLCRLNG